MEREKRTPIEPDQVLTAQELDDSSLDQGDLLPRMRAQQILDQPSWPPRNGCLSRLSALIDKVRLRVQHPMLDEIFKEEK